MPSWIALLPAASCENGGLDAMHLGWWALQFTPRVALLEDAVVLEVQASERLFGGATQLWRRVCHGAGSQGATAAAQAATAHAALALARVSPLSPKQAVAGPADALEAPQEDLAQNTAHKAPLSAQLAPLPLHSLSAVGRHAETLQRLGCRTLGQVRALPRSGLSRRFGDDLLHALDAAHGSRPEAFDWLVLPPVFERRHELPWRLDNAAALHQAFERLLRELGAWLAGHQAGTQVLKLSWCHDWAHHGRSRWHEHGVRLAEPTADVPRLSRMVGEHLRRIELSAPVTDIGLRVDTCVPREPESQSLFAELAASGEGLASDALSTAGQRAQRSALLNLLDRLSIRLGPERVMLGRLQADHRLAHSQRWQPAVSVLAQACATASAPRPGPLSPLARVGTGDLLASDAPQPTWVLADPLSLALAGTAVGPRETPQHQGPLRLLAGPHRIEAGWWDDSPGAQPTQARDHHLASSPQAGLLWVFRERHAPQDGSSPWRLHGFFA